jgi:NADPH-dependent 2,4-dienoyl-CoA reductase/sulfur reductase-like enzyme/rhodanese-related sulfurtransferase|uniref:FAD-dependent oxidoreductase n=1 Tax=Candidatus Planktophila sp. TaxID=2175601 RepID=UPI00404949D4
MTRIVVIGGVAGGMSAATRLRRLDADAEIIVVEKSGYVSYANCGLPYYVGGIIEEERDLLLQTPASLHARFRLDVRVSSEVTSISRSEKTVAVTNLLSGETYELSYDKLILSPGASPIVPPIPGVERALTLRTVEDVERIVARVDQKPATAVVIGGGFIGVEIAENLIHRGIKTAVIEASDQVLAPLDPEMATLVAKEMIAHGVDLQLGVSASAIGTHSVTLSDGSEVPAELVILAIGVRPEISLAKAAGIKVGTRNGIEVDDFNRTSDLDIYAVGDAAEKTDSLDGTATLVPLANIANRHGRIVADHINGRIVRPVTTIGTAIVKVFDLMIATTGWNEKRLVAADRPHLIIHTHPNSHAGYYPDAKQMTLKLIFEPTTGEILGAQGVGIEGVDKRIDVIATAMRGGITAPELADLELAYAPPFGSAKDPVNMLGYIAENMISGLIESSQWSQIDDFVSHGFKLIDVRSAAEFGRGSIPGAVNIPVDEIRERKSEITNHNLLVNCQVGQRGHTASLLLKELGFNAMNLDGGYLTWSNSPAATKIKVAL